MDRLNFVKLILSHLRNLSRMQRQKKKTQQNTTKQKKKTEKTRQAEDNALRNLRMRACWDACLSSERSSQESLLNGQRLEQTAYEEGLWMAETHGRALSVISHEGNTN